MALLIFNKFNKTKYDNSIQVSILFKVLGFHMIIKRYLISSGSFRIFTSVHVRGRGDDSLGTGEVMF